MKMSRNILKLFGKRATTLANIISAASIVVMCSALATRYAGPFLQEDFWPNLAGQQKPILNTRNVDWSTAPVNVVLALQTDCGYCTKNLAFYRDLAHSVGNSGKKINLYTLFPDNAMKTTDYVTKNGLSAVKMLYGNFAEIEIKGTPTVFILDREGRIQQRYDGFLPAEKQTLVFAALNLARRISSFAPNSELNGEDLGLGDIPFASVVDVKNAALDKESPMLVIDVRERGDFQHEHIAGAINIPLEELETRAVHELPFQRHLAIYWQNPALTCTLRGTGARAPSTGEIAAVVLKRRLQAKHVEIIDQGLEDLSTLGVPLAKIK